MPELSDELIEKAARIVLARRHGVAVEDYEPNTWEIPPFRALAEAGLLADPEIVAERDQLRERKQADLDELKKTLGLTRKTLRQNVEWRDRFRAERDEDRAELGETRRERDIALWLHAEAKWWLDQYMHDVTLWKRQVDELTVEVRRLRADAVEVKRLDDEAYLRHREALYEALGCAGPEGSLIALIKENVAAVVAERDGLQARHDAALAVLRQSLKPSAVVCDEAVAALQGDQHAEEAGRG